MKCIKRHIVVQYGQQRHCQDEKNILMKLNTPFCLDLHTTFKDDMYVYLLTEPYMGGDMFKLMHERGPFSDAVSRFYVACVVEAFAYLHKLSICYRDLKPENLMINQNGYVVVVDMGFCKEVPNGKKTYTFCGTPEYIAPEIIQQVGHNYAVDYWSLGVLVYELLSKKTPFLAGSDLKMYANIQKGIHAVSFSSKIKSNAKSIVQALCQKEATNRLGYQKGGIDDIRKHKWYAGFDWKRFQAQQEAAPLIPQIKDPLREAIKSGTFRPIKIPKDTTKWADSF